MESADCSGNFEFFLSRADELTEKSKDFFYRYFKSDGADADGRDKTALQYFNSAIEWEELLQNHIFVPLERLSPGSVSVLRGLWRGRALAESEKTEPKSAEP